jgi:3-oxoacyl-[acyl-carrier protein] reductase
MDLQNKIALITGASRGIGQNISYSLAEKGVHVIITARTESQLLEVKKNINSKGGKATAIPADLSKREDILNLFDEVNKRFGKLEILINNAGIGVFGKIVDFPIEDFDKIMNVNLRAVYLCCQQALKIMIPARTGHIINISSVVGVKGYPNQTAYTASKHAIMGLTKSLAAEIQEYGICVSVILPGGVDTEFVRQARPDLDRSILIPPTDISNTILYLLSLSDNAMVDEICIRRRTNKPF